MKAARPRRVVGIEENEGQSVLPDHLGGPILTHPPEPMVQFVKGYPSFKALLAARRRIFPAMGLWGKIHLPVALVAGILLWPINRYNCFS